MEQQRADSGPPVLDSPALRRVLTRLESCGEPRSAAELAGDLGLHVTTVRSHLEQLERAGLVAHEVVVSGRRGRPGFRFRPTGRNPERAREELIGALAMALAGSAGGGDDPALAAGRAWADGVEVSGADAATALTTAFVELGFDPEPGEGVIRLRSCPFRESARAYPEVVCRVHLGLAQRLAEQSTGGAPAVELQPFVEPELCVLTLPVARPA